MRRAYIDPARCVGCGACIRVCPTGAARMMPGWKCRVDPGRCIGCGKCASICHRSTPILIKEEKESPAV